MQDKFTYTTSNLNGHATTLGSGTWTTTGTGISTSGSQAVINLNGGNPGSGGVVASIPFTPSANTLYTLTTTLKFVGTTGSDCWVGMGFSNANNGGGNAPWALVRPQASSSSNGGSAFCSGGSTWPWSGWITAAQYANPMVATLTWNTATGVTQYYINNVLQSTGTSVVPGGQYYAFFQGFQTGNKVNVKDITLTAQTLSLASMQDSFNYTVSNINNHAPTVTPVGGIWTTNNSGGSSIAVNGAQANIIVNSGTVGSEMCIRDRSITTRQP